MYRILFEIFVCWLNLLIKFEEEYYSLSNNVTCIFTRYLTHRYKLHVSGLNCHPRLVTILCVGVYVLFCECVFVRMCMFVWNWMCVGLCECTYVCVNVTVCVCECVCLCECVYICVRVNIQICVVCTAECTCTAEHYHNVHRCIGLYDTNLRWILAPIN